MGLQNQFTIIFFSILFNCTAKPLHNGHLGGRRKWPWQRGGHDRKVLTRVNVHVSTVHQKSGRYNRKVVKERLVFRLFLIPSKWPLLDYHICIITIVFNFLRVLQLSQENQKTIFTQLCLICRC